MEKSLNKIYYIQYDDEGNEIGRGVYHKGYKNLGNALRMGRKLYGPCEILSGGQFMPKLNGQHYRWTVNWRDPWTEYHKESTCGCCGKTYDRPESASGFDRGWYVNVEDRNDYYSRLFKSICYECADKILDFVESLKEESK